MSLKPVGVVGEVSTPTSVEVRASNPLPTGTYVYLRFRVRDLASSSESVREVVGLVGSTMYRSLVPVVTSPEVGSIESFTGSLAPLKHESSMKALIIADITEGRAEAPRYPPPPETPVYLATVEHLRPIYAYNPPTSVRLGYLVGFEELEVMVNVNALAKHLLVVGTTGSGKSNLVAVVADRVAQLGGSVVIFDVHGEYRGLVSESSNVHVVDYEATINLVKAPIDMLTKFIIPEPSATKQRRLVRNALRDLNAEVVRYAEENRLPYSEAVKRLYERAVTSAGIGRGRPEQVHSAVEAYRELLKQRLRKLGKDEKAAEDAVDKVDDFFEWHRVDVDAPEVSEVVGYGRVVVVDVSTLTDEEKDYMLKVVAEDLLWALKEQVVPPTLLVVEEAHVFISSDTSTKSKEALQRFSREGRKFGGMLAIVSQRPRALDQNVVSQVQNFALLRLVQQKDRSFILEVTDVLSDEYTNMLPSLPPGHAILLGEWVGRYPAYVKVDLHRGKRVGATPDIVGIWRSRSSQIRELLSSGTPSSEWEEG